MQITSAYNVQIKQCPGMNYFKTTMSVFRQSVNYAVPKIDEMWVQISAIPVADNQRRNYTEHLFHKTKDNPSPVYGEFDTLFKNMPSYFRRAVLTKATGIVSSYRSNYENWLENGSIGRPPVLPQESHAVPVFYRGNTFKEPDKEDTKILKEKMPDEKNILKLKLYDGHTWDWYFIPLSSVDMKYIQKHWSGKKENCPVLQKSHSRWVLTFSFTEDITFKSDEDISDRPVCAVDLGINTDATCSILMADGTVLARKFINFGSDKDRLYKLLNRIKKFQRANGSKYSSGLWHYAQALNKRLSDRIAKAIVKFADEYHAHTIVFEYLDMKRKIKSGKKQKIAMWRKNSIQKMAEHKAHRLGVRISHVCAWGTSKLAYDGSGKVERDNNNYSLCTFTTGKRYNCDLSASYNIGSRYFIRELLKPLPATEVSRIQAKVPECGRRTSCTLNTLKELHAVLTA